MKSLPSRTRLARGVEVRTKSARGAARRQRQSEIRSSPVYAGCKIKPLEKLAFLQYVSTRAPAVSDRIEAIRQAERPLPHSTEAMSFPSFRAIHADVLKGMISYRIGFSECEHGRASKGQHARRRFFSESRSACQGQNSDQLGTRFCSEIGSGMAPLARFRRAGRSPSAILTSCGTCRSPQR